MCNFSSFYIVIFTEMFAYPLSDKHAECRYAFLIY